MKLELEEAAKYLVAYLQEAKYSEEDVSRFSEHFIKCLEEKYSNCWHPKDPLRGNGFRCLQTLARTNLDPTLRKVFENAKVESKPFLSSLPQDFTMWIDPGDVSVRAGNRFAPIVSIYSENGDCPYADKVLKRSIDNRPFNKMSKFYKTRSKPSLPPTRNGNNQQNNSPILNYDAKLHPVWTTGSTGTRSASSSPPTEQSPSSSYENQPPPQPPHSVYEYGYSTNRLIRGGSAAEPNGLSFDPANHSRQTSPIFTTTTSAPSAQRYNMASRGGFDTPATNQDIFSHRAATTFNNNHGGFQHPYLMSQAGNYHPQQQQQQQDVYTTAAAAGTGGSHHHHNPTTYFAGASPLFEHLSGGPQPQQPTFDMYLPDLNGAGSSSTQAMFADSHHHHSTIQQLSQPSAASSAAVNSCFYPLSVR